MENSKLLCLIFGLLFICPDLTAQQQRYLVYFKDKLPSGQLQPSAYLSGRALERRARQHIRPDHSDLPVARTYLDHLACLDVKVESASRWLNAALVIAGDDRIKILRKLPFVHAVRPVGGGERPSARANTLAAHSLQTTSGVSSGQLDYGNSYNQIHMLGMDEMHTEGFAGEGKLIAVIDDGFLHADTLSLFDYLFQTHRVRATYDFVENDENVYDNGLGHGTQVLSVLAAYRPGMLIGGAWQSDFLLLRSENDNSESILEEFNWARAAEFADSAGADIINTSLGYNTFDDASENHTYADLNGDSTIIAIAADMAASRGILVVVAAGNEGAGSWKYILTPADADSVIAVGGVTPSGDYFPLSSIGPAADGRIKPDLAAQGDQVITARTSGGVSSKAGTSFAAPLVAGLAAGLWQYAPDLSSMELTDYLKRSASRFTQPDVYLGYGIPSYRKARTQIEADRSHTVSLFPNPVEDGPLVLNMDESETGNAASIFVFDLSGRLLGEERITSLLQTNRLRTDVSSYARGMYIAKVVTMRKEYIFKFLKY